MDAWLENTPFCHAVLVLGLKKKMNFTSLNISRNWFWPIANEISNDAKEHIRDLNQYVNRNEDEMQTALGCSHDCYTVLDELIEYIADNSMEASQILKEIKRLRKVMRVDQKKLYAIKKSNSMNAIGIARSRIDSVIKLFDKLSKYIKLEEKGKLNKDGNGNVVIEKSNFIMESLDYIENHKFVTVILFLFAVLIICCLLYCSGNIKEGDEAMKILKTGTERLL